MTSLIEADFGAFITTNQLADRPHVVEFIVADYRHDRTLIDGSFDLLVSLVSFLSTATVTCGSVDICWSIRATAMRPSRRSATDIDWLQ